MSWDDDHKSICQVWGCELPAREFGVCVKHLKLADMGCPRDEDTIQVLNLIKKYRKDGAIMTDGVCRVPGCGKTKIAGRGLCMMHYLYKNSKDQARVDLFNRYAAPLNERKAKPKVKSESPNKKLGRPRKVTPSPMGEADSRSKSRKPRKVRKPTVADLPDNQWKVETSISEPHIDDNLMPKLCDQLKKASPVGITQIAKTICNFIGSQCMLADDGSLLVTAGDKIARVCADGTIFADYLPGTSGLDGSPT